MIYCIRLFLQGKCVNQPAQAIESALRENSVVMNNHADGFLEWCLMRFSKKRRSGGSKTETEEEK